MWTRREVLAVAAGMPAAGPLIIDTHAHIYSADEKRYLPIDKPLRPPAGSGTVGRLRRMMKLTGVTGACLVQTSTFYRWDNQLICDTAAANPGWSAGVCTLDPDNSGSPAIIKDLVQRYGIRAMRSVPAKDGSISNPGVKALWRACGDAGIVINVLCSRDNAENLAAMLGMFPRQSVVIDHCLNLKAGAGIGRTLEDMLRLAKYSNAHAKLTFLATGSALEYPFRDMHEPCRKIIAAYSPERCVWGSDFPNELWTPKATYGQSLRLFTHELGLDEKSKRAILGQTAQGLYFPGGRLSRGA
jgi:predicted TIM-barrel fold metal-dependent hydrolase